MHFSEPGESRILPKLFRDEKDVIDRLPTIAAAKLKALRDQHANVRATSLIPYEEAKNYVNKKARQESHISEIRRQGAKENDAQLIVEIETLEKLTKKARELTAESNGRREHASRLGRLVQNIEYYLQSIPQKQTITPAPDVAFPKIKNHLEAVESQREIIQTIKQNLQNTFNAPIPSEEAKRRAAATISSYASNGPDVIGLIEGGQLEWPMKFAPSVFVTGATGGITEPHQEVDTLSLFCWLHRDQLIAAINAEIDENADDKAALNEVERAEKIKKCKDLLLAEERHEEWIILQAEAQNIIINRREDADPRAVLQIIGPEPRDD